jgi:hypothetical protein
MQPATKNHTLTISVRGSLASEFMQLSSKPGTSQQSLKEYLLDLVHGNDPDLLVSSGEDGLIVGRRSEIGKYPPNW